MEGFRFPQRTCYLRHLLGRRDLEGAAVATVAVRTKHYARRPLLMSELRAAIALCSRPLGATAQDLSIAMCARRQDDAPRRLRQYLRRYPRIGLSLFSVRMSPQERLAYRYVGPGKTYHVRRRESVAA